MAFAALRNWLLRGPPDPHGRDAQVPGEPGAVMEGFATSGLSIVNPSRPTLPDRAAVWTASRLAIAEELWGTGYLTPGGAAEVLRFAAPIGLSAASSLLLLGTGAGGPAQTLAADLGVWVTGFEADADLAEIGARRIQRSGAALAKRATIAPWNPGAPHFPARVAHHALALEAIGDAEPAVVLAAIAAALRPHGHIVVVETVAAVPLDPADPDIAAWCRLEGRTSAVPGPDAITKGFSRLGFDVRVVEDVSARHMRLAVLGWRHLVRAMAQTRPDHGRAAAVVAQAELWTRRIRLMHEGRIRQMRWHAIGGSGGRGGAAESAGA